MKKFSFRLEKVLNYRKHLETRARIGLAEAVGERCRREASVKRIEEMRRDLSDKCGGEKQMEIDVFRYRLYHDFFRKLNDDRQTADIELLQADLSVSRHRSALMNESMKKKALERLKEIQSVRHRAFSDKEEQKELDETALISKGEVI
ncbi:MAG: flagellar protein FliJ [Thermodesulfobacteriota bacterium]|nr:flagellar protein FliJ [Thermodesulfobacteriota bacterium]